MFEAENFKNFAMLYYTYLDINSSNNCFVQCTIL